MLGHLNLHGQLLGGGGGLVLGLKPLDILRQWALGLRRSTKNFSDGFLDQGFLPSCERECKGYLITSDLKVLGSETTK